MGCVTNGPPLQTQARRRLRLLRGQPLCSDRTTGEAYHRPSKCRPASSLRARLRPAPTFGLGFVPLTIIATFAHSVGTGLQPAPTNTSPPPPALIAGTPIPNGSACGVHGVPGIPSGTFGGVGSGRGGSQTLPPSIDDRPTVGTHVRGRDMNARPAGGSETRPHSDLTPPTLIAGTPFPNVRNCGVHGAPGNPPAGTRQRALTADSPHANRNAASCLCVSGRRNLRG
jgi:hypothetical protein